MTGLGRRFESHRAEKQLTKGRMGDAKSNVYLASEIWEVGDKGKIRERQRIVYCTYLYVYLCVCGHDCVGSVCGEKTM